MRLLLTIVKSCRCSQHLFPVQENWKSGSGTELLCGGRSGGVLVATGEGTCPASVSAAFGPSLTFARNLRSTVSKWKR